MQIDRGKIWVQYRCVSVILALPIQKDCIINIWKRGRKGLQNATCLYLNTISLLFDYAFRHWIYLDREFFITYFEIWTPCLALNPLHEPILDECVCEPKIICHSKHSSSNPKNTKKHNRLADNRCLIPRYKNTANRTGPQFL